MNYLYLTYALLAFLLCSEAANGQKKNKKDEAESFYIFKNDWSSAPDLASAAYFMHPEKENDSTYVCRFYNKTGPMVKQESFKDEQLSIPNGRFCWYNSEGYLDSIGWVKDGHKDDSWTYYRKDKSYLSIKYKDGKIFEKRDSDADIYMDSTGAQSSLKEKLIKDSIYRDSLMLARDSVKPNQVEAKFKGNWNGYLERNLKTPERLINVMGTGKHFVTISFRIDKEGNVSEILLFKSCEWSADAEVLRVLKNSPRWEPAQQNGKPVIYRQRQMLAFTVTER